jgi:hypothetical protein
MKFIREVFKLLKDPDGLLNVLGIVLICSMVAGIVGIVAIILAVIKLINSL